VFKEKETFKLARQKILKENIVSTSRTKSVDDIPSITILGSCVNLLSDQNYLQVLQSMLEKCNSREEMKLEHKRVNYVHNKRRTSREFRLNKNIRDFNMGDIILDLGSKVNVFPKKTWEDMGEPTLGF
jgi:hypothetical protein